MAEALLEVVLDNLSSLIRNKLGLFLGFDQDLKRLSSTLTAIKATLEDAEEKQFSNRAIKDWLQKLKDAAYILDDILDEIQYHGQANQVKSSCLSNFHPKHVVFRHRIAMKMKRIRERLDEIAEERIKFHLTEMHTERRTGVIDWRQTTSIIAQSQIYGREADKDKIVEFLVGDASNFEDLSIFPIVEDFSLKRISKAIVESASGHACEDLDLEPLQRRLQELLRSKRYLLVLDDVWDDDQDNWDRLKCVLACGAKGASILVTTRLATVASIMETVLDHHRLSMLSDNDCWEVFKQRAFGPNEVERPELVVIGKEIVRKCGGVPLAAKALGSLLRFKREEKEWLYVKESKLWNLTQDEDSIMAALRLSYLNLPIKLRQCFAFCALFPKDTKINKYFLIILWVANGFISSNEILEAEDIGDEVCNELYWRSFFQDIETDEFGKIRNFKMHDLVHDLAQSVAKDVCHITNDNDVNAVFERIRHLSIYTRKSFKDIDSIQSHQVKSLKTCLLPYNDVDQLPSDILRCYSLRALLHKHIRNNLSSSIGNLKCLRYLDLSYGKFKALPESLCKLLNLQILGLDNCRLLQKLPNRLKCLKALRHLYLTGCDSLSSLPPEIGELTFLRTLRIYFVGRQRGFLLAELERLNLKGDLHIKHLERVKSVMDAKDANMGSKQLNKLVLSWGINDESQVQQNMEQILEVLQPHPQQLQTLYVEGYRGFQFPEWIASCIALEILDLKCLPNLIRLSREDGENMFQRLSRLHISDCPKLLALPCLPSIQRLYISHCNSLEPLTEQVLQGLHSLKKLDIRWCGKFNFSTGFQYLTSLEDLLIQDCPEVKGFPEALQHMTSLQSLTLCDLRNLRSLPHWFGNLTLLRSLDIGSCPKLMCLPMSIQCLSALKSLTIWHCPVLEKRCKKEIGEDWQKIAHIPNIDL